MLPSVDKYQNIQLESYASKSYFVDKKYNRIIRETGGLEAYVQAVEKVLNTERYSTPIYSSNYGVELESLIGYPINVAKVDIRRRLQEALEVDDRFIEITDFKAEVKDRTTLDVRFTIRSTVGITTQNFSVRI